jgi:ribosome-associated protein
LARSSTLSKTKTSSQVLNDLIIDAIQDIKGKKIVKMDLKNIGDTPADTFIICHGESTTQVRAISQNISKRVEEELGMKPVHIEGLMGSKWILVDYFDTVIHVFHPETRDFYDLEDLWSDANTVEYEDLN